MNNHALIKIGNGHAWFSFDDYDEKNERIADIFDKYGIKCTFFIETALKDARDQIEQFHKRGHHIGAHTIHHVQDMKLLNSVECMSEIDGCKKMIESITKEPCEVFAYPRGRYNEEVINQLKIAGFKYSRTTLVLNVKSDDPFRQHTTIHLFPNRKEYVGRDIETLFNFYFDDVKKNGGILSIWGHAEELDKYNLWELLEKMVKQIAEK